jgi:DNA-binding transcriptional regulator YdaS (Cro superfamily)
MTLIEYLADRQLTNSAFAHKIGVPASTVHRWIRGYRQPSIVYLLKIERATGGKVRVKDFYPVEAAE